MKKLLMVLIVGCMVASVVYFSGCVEEKVEEEVPELSLGETAIIYGISFTVDRYEFTDSYVTEHNKTVYPADGAKFLWIYVKAQNKGEIAREIPSRDWRGMQLLYKGSEIHPCFDHEIPPMGGRMYPKYGEEIYPDVTREGWVLFEVPININMSQARLHVERYYGEEATWNLGS